MQEHEVQSSNSEHMSYHVVKIVFIGLATRLYWLLSMNAVMDEIQVTDLRKLSKWREREIDSFHWVYQYVCSCQVHRLQNFPSDLGLLLMGES